MNNYSVKKKSTILVMTLMLVSLASASGTERLIIDTTFFLEQEEPKINNIEVRETTQITNLGEDHGEYKIKLINDKGNTVDEGRFSPGFQQEPTPVFGPDGERLSDEDHSTRHEVDRTLFLRFHESVTKVRWLKNDEAVKDIDLVQRFCSPEDDYTDYCERHGAHASTFSQEWFENYLFDETPWRSPILWITFIALTTTFLIYRRKRSSKTDQTEFKQYDREKDERNF